MPNPLSPSQQSAPGFCRWLTALLIGLSATAGMSFHETALMAAPPAADSDDVTPAPDSSGGLIGGLRNLIQSNSLLTDDEGVSNGLLDQLDQAAGELNQIRQSNQEAIRQANRQPRIGRNGSSPNLVLIQLQRMPFLDPAKIPADEAPNYRRFVTDSLTFTQHYTASSDLSTARWSLLSGKNPALNPADASAPTIDMQSLPVVLWNGGYTTGLIGQWDQSALPTERGFDEWIGFKSRTESMAYPAAVSIDATQMKLPGNAENQQRVHAIDLFAAEGVHFLQRNSNGRRPFFLMVSFPAFETPEDSAATGVPGERIDQAIGTLVAAIEKLQLQRNTCIILTAESGAVLPLDTDDAVLLPSGERSFRHGLGEANLHIPLCISWPGQIAPGVTDHLSVSWDLFPSLLELTTTNRRPGGLAGISFAPLLRRQGQKSHPLIYWATADKSAQAVRQGNWKGLHLKHSPSVQLFDLSTDPGETANIAAEHPDVVKGMLAKQ